jgi:hypothetical protein
MTREEAIAENDRIRARQNGKIRECLRFLQKTAEERRVLAHVAVQQEIPPAWLDDNAWTEAHLREFTEFDVNVSPGDVVTTDDAGKPIRVIITEAGKKFLEKP